LLLGWILAATSAQAVNFPGPVILQQGGVSLSGCGLRLPDTSQDDFVSGTGDGFLNLNRYNPTSRSFTILHRFLLGGRVVAIVPWLGRPVQQIGLVVATTEPDRIVFFDVSDEFPYLMVMAEVPLEEDPGEVAFVGNTLTGPWELAVTLPGVDQVVFLAESADVWSVTATVDSGDQPSGLIGVDLDGDSFSEGVVAHAGPLSGTLGVFRRQPDATYVLETIVLPDVAPALVAAHDLDGDGRQELAVAGSQVPQVVFYAAGSAELVEISRAALTVRAHSLHLIDLADGAKGLLAANEDRGLVEFVGFNAGLWNSLDLYYPGCQPHDLFVADLDGDDLGDLVTLGGGTEILTVMWFVRNQRLRRRWVAGPVCRRQRRNHDQFVSRHAGGAAVPNAAGLGPGFRRRRRCRGESGFGPGIGTRRFGPCGR